MRVTYASLGSIGSPKSCTITLKTSMGFTLPCGVTTRFIQNVRRSCSNVKETGVFMYVFVSIVRFFFGVTRSHTALSAAL